MKRRIRLTENSLHRIVKESVLRVLNEGEPVYDERYMNDFRRQMSFKSEVLAFLEKLGYKKWSDRYDDNEWMVVVSINDYSDVRKIEDMVGRKFGIANDMSFNVNYNSNLIGKDERAEIHLPSILNINKARLN